VDEETTEAMIANLMIRVDKLESALVTVLENILKHAAKETPILHLGVLQTVRQLARDGLLPNVDLPKLCARHLVWFHRTQLDSASARDMVMMLGERPSPPNV
jgi:hypothetical protein